MPRSINELLNKYCFADVRLFNNTLRDYSPYAKVPYQTAPNNAPFARKSNQLSCLDFNQKVGDCLLVPTLATLSGQELAFEFMVWIDAKVQWGTSGYSYFFNGGASCYSLMFTNKSIRFNCGTSLDTAASMFSVDVPTHIILTRDSSNNGIIYINGYSVASGAVGAGAPAYPLGIMNNAATGTLGTRGFCYLFRTYNAYVTADEALVLYQYNRAKLGCATKRSGILSRIN